VRGCWLGLFLVSAIVVFLGAVAFALLATPAEKPPQFTPVPVSTEAAGRFDTKFATVRSATEPTTIEITDEEATSKVAELLANESDAPKVDKPQVAFRDGKVYLSGTTSDTPIAINFLITARIEVADGKPKVIVEDVAAGRLPVPGALRSQVDDLVAEQERLMDDLTINVTDVQVLDGKVVLTGQPK
jgi:hypothetical protein